MSEFTQEEKKQLFSRLERIERGVYGDPHNEVSGLNDRVKQVEGDMKKAKRAAWMIMGAGIAVFEGISETIKHFFK